MRVVLAGLVGERLVRLLGGCYGELVERCDSELVREELQSGAVLRVDHQHGWIGDLHDVEGFGDAEGAPEAGNRPRPCGRARRKAEWR